MFRYTLSSRTTFLEKFILPTLSYTAGIVINYGILNVDDYPIYAYLIVLLTTLWGFIFYIHVFYSLKKVEIDDQYLYVSNFRKEVKIPFSAIRYVEFVKPFAKVVLKDKSDFGTSIIFSIKIVELINYFAWDLGFIKSIELIREKIENE